MKLLLLTIFTIFILTSCDTDKNRCLKSNGETKTVKYDIENFDKINIQSNFEVIIDNSATCAITITAGKNLIPYIEYSIVNNEITIKDKNGCLWLRERAQPTITLSAPLIKEVTIYSACDLKTIDTLKVETLSIQNWAGIFTTDILIEADSLYFRSHASTGDYKIEGTSNYAYMYNKGSGYLLARRLVCNTIYIVHSSIANSEVNASTLLMIENIEYGTVYSFSELCPSINDNDNDYGTSFINIGCP